MKNSKIISDSHIHINESKLDKIGEDINGKLTYNGEIISGGSSGSNIDDINIGIDKTYSSSKIKSLIDEVNNTNFTKANEAKFLTINAIGDASLATTNTFAEISNSLLSKKQSIVTALSNKGIIATQSDDIAIYATKINSIIQNPQIKNTKLNKLSGDTYQVELTNPTTIQNISTSVLEYKAGDTGVVKYDCNFNNGDASSFNTTIGQHLIFDGTMRQDNNINTITMMNEGFIDTYTTYSATLDKISFYKVSSINEATVDTNEILTINGTYNPTLVQANSDISLIGIDKISSITWNATATNTSKLLLVYSIDSGVTWKGYDSVNHTVLDIASVSDLNEVKAKGISITNLNAFTQVDLDNIRSGSPKIRFAYYIEKNDMVDVLENDKITLVVDMLGEDIFSTHYTLAFDGNKTLTYTFNANNTYTIIYTDNN